MLDTPIWYFKKLLRRLRGLEPYDGVFAYRKYLFQQLKSEFGEDFFRNKRILEIGPKDGEDTFRLETLNPSEIVMFDLPDKQDVNEKWLAKISVPNSYYVENFLYADKELIEKIGKFDLIYFTGVLYHNPEQLKFIKKLYDLLNIEGVMVLESSVSRNIFTRNKNIVEIWYPDTYRNTTTITHLPSKKAIISWLKMVGFTKIIVSNCYDPEDYNIRKKRFACITQRQETDKPEVYYKKQIDNSNYYIGGSN